MAANGYEVGFTFIAVYLGVSKATGYRLLNVLKDRNCIIKDEETGKYRPGPGMSFLSQSLPMIEILKREIPPVLQPLI